MEIKGKIIEILKLQEGSGKNGPWKKQDIIIETESKYPRKICIAVWGDKINYETLQIGNFLSFNADIESKEFNGKWYTEIKAVSFKTEDKTQEIKESKNTPFDDSIFKRTNEDDDLDPF